MSVARNLSLICIFALGAAAAAESVGACYENEIDPQTKQIYQNEAQWKADREGLWAKAPSSPNFYRLKLGYDVSVEESKNSRGIGSDKRKHCYVGCRIANEVGHDVAVYAGYYKEDKDLLDCNPKTNFDLKDIEATVLGADIALKNPDKADGEYCRTECRAAIRR